MPRARLILAISLACLLPLPAARPLPAHASHLPVPSRAGCTAAVPLTLQPGAHWPGANTTQVPSDIPPGPLTVDVPLYPNATPTTQQETIPTFSTPGVLYLKSASATYLTPDHIPAVQAWYLAAFAACGHAFFGSGSSGNRSGQVSQGISESMRQGPNSIQINLSFQSTSAGTLILYVATAVTPPAYPVAGSVLRVPGTPVSLTVTLYGGLNSGPHALRPIRAVTIHSRPTIASIADEINHLPKLLGGSVSCPMDDGSHLTLVFTDVGGSRHTVTVGLRGCRLVDAPPAPAGRLPDDPKLLPRLQALLTRAGSRKFPYPFDARTLHVVRARPLGSTPGRFLSTGQNGLHVLYLSRGTLSLAAAGGGHPRILARRIADASFTVADQAVLARPAGQNLRHLLLIDTRSGATSPFSLPAGASLIGRSAGANVPDLSDAQTCNLQYIWFIQGRSLRGIDELHPHRDVVRSTLTLPPPARGRLAAISCSGTEIALYRPGHGLQVRRISYEVGGAGIHLHGAPLTDVSLLVWAPDERHLLVRTGSILSILDVGTGHMRAVWKTGNRIVRGVAWDPWSRVVAVSLSSPNSPAGGTIGMIDAAGRSSRRLSVPFSGAERLQWSSWRGTVLGVTQYTPGGSRAWELTLPSPPADPGRPG